jgi:23S rRNA (cytosine1962-C5)-methyltransferase
MDFAPSSIKKPITLYLQKDLVRAIKRGHPWVYNNALVEHPDAPVGTWALLKDRKGKEVAWGFYDPQGQLSFRACIIHKKEMSTDWGTARLQTAKLARKHLIENPQTTAFRLVNGEGDGLPGLVIDIYGETAILQVDGAAPERFWNKEAVAQWLGSELPIQHVFYKPRRKEEISGVPLLGDIPPSPLHIKENGALYAVDVVAGQKTGFFLDQRDNRLRIRHVAKGKRVLNMFGYTGGFSINAGLGGATQVTTVDLSRPAIEMAQDNWAHNKLPPEHHHGVVADAFDFFDDHSGQHGKFDISIVDPPSFAPSQETVKRAVDSYTRLYTSAIQRTQPGGIFCPSSCSSHIPHALFLEICTQAFSNARSRGFTLGIYGQAEDHPYPLACPEMRYLKFAMFRVFK